MVTLTLPHIIVLSVLHNCVLYGAQLAQYNRALGGYDCKMCCLHKHA